MKNSPINLPSTIGVYIFKTGSDEILYIGKSVNIKTRVKSHFENAKLDAKECAIVENSTKIETIPTESEFKALLLESQLIQKYRPKYNKIWMDDKSYLYVRITVKDEYPKISLVRKTEIVKDKSKYYGPFSSRRTLESLLREIRRVIPFCTAKKITKRPCFYSKIGLCNPCPNHIERELRTFLPLKKIYRQNIRQIIKIFEGKTDFVLKNLRRELDNLSKTGKYEDAILVRDRILKFEKLISERSFSETPSAYYVLPASRSQGGPTMHLLDLLRPFFPSLSNLHRLECYDVSNLGGKQATAAMTVAIDGQIDKSQYRKFKINSESRISNLESRIKDRNHNSKIINSNQDSKFQILDSVSRNDWQMMLGILQRRFSHREWEFPDLLIVDGGKPQVRMAVVAMQELNLQIPVVGIAKNPDRLVMGVAADNMPTYRPELNNPGFNLIRLLRDEAHRFGHKYHLQLRERSQF